MKEVNYPEGVFYQNGFNCNPMDFMVIGDEEFFIPYLRHMEVWSWNEDLSSLSRGQKVHAWKRFKDVTLKEALEKFPA